MPWIKSFKINLTCRPSAMISLIHPCVGANSIYSCFQTFFFYSVSFFDSFSSLMLKLEPLNGSYRSNSRKFNCDEGLRNVNKSDFSSILSLFSVFTSPFTANSGALPPNGTRWPCGRLRCGDALHQRREDGAVTFTPPSGSCLPARDSPIHILPGENGSDLQTSAHVTLGHRDLQ